MNDIEQTVIYRERWLAIYKLLKEGDDEIYNMIGYPEDIMDAELTDEDWRYIAKYLALSEVMGKKRKK